MTSLEQFIFVSTFFVALCGALEVEYLFGDDEAEVNATYRNAKVFPFVAIVRLPDEQCGMNRMRQGTCRTQKQCTRQNGTPINGVTCGNGYGICCQFQAMCTITDDNNSGEITVSNSGTHITNPTGSSNSGSTCRINLRRPSSAICQARLDFVDFNLQPPDQNGDCTTDFLTISGAGNLNQFITCGVNDGQQLYLDYGSGTDTITLAITTAMANSAYDILVTYIKCNDSTPSKRKGRKFIKVTNNGGDNENDNTILVERAPDGCAQYYTGSSGEITSFNYVSQAAGAVATQNQINNERYSVCIKSPPGATMITWSPCTVNPTFCISTTPGSPGIVGNCPTDSVEIPGSPGGKYCGCDFPASVTSTIKPFMLYVDFNDVELPGLNDPVDPATGCGVSSDCLVFGAPQPYPPPIVCNTPEGNAQGAICTIRGSFQNLIDFANPGFCLRYMIS